MRWNFLKLHPCQYSRIAYKISQFICHRPVMKSTYSASFRENFLELHQAFYVYCVKTTCVELQSAINQWHFTCRRKYLHGNVSDFHWRDFIKVHTKHSTHIANKELQFDCSRSIMDTSYSEHSTFTAISRHTFQGLSLNATWNTPRVFPTNGASLLAVDQK
jgi:hypothetical protein